MGSGRVFAGGDGRGLGCCLWGRPFQGKPVLRSGADISGQWQGTLQDGNSHRRLVLKIARAGDGWDVTFYSIDQDARPFRASSITLDGPTFQASVDSLGLTYKGTLSGDRNAIVGMRVQGASTLPLTLERAAGKSAWKVPEPLPPAKQMAADADVSFKKVSIKRSKSGGERPYGFHLDDETFVTEDTSLSDLILVRLRGTRQTDYGRSGLDR